MPKFTGVDPDAAPVHAGDPGDASQSEPSAASAPKTQTVAGQQSASAAAPAAAPQPPASPAAGDHAQLPADFVEQMKNVIADVVKAATAPTSPPTTPAGGGGNGGTDPQQMLDDMDEEARLEKAAFDAEITGIALRRAHHEVVTDASRAQRRAVLNRALEIRSALNGTTPSLAPGTPPPDTTPPTNPTDAPGDPGDPTGTPAPTAMPTTRQGIIDLIHEVTDPDLRSLRQRVDGLEAWSNGRKVGRYKPATPQPGTPTPPPPGGLAPTGSLFRRGRLAPASPATQVQSSTAPAAPAAPAVPAT